MEVSKCCWSQIMIRCESDAVLAVNMAGDLQIVLRRYFAAWKEHCNGMSNITIKSDQPLFCVIGMDKERAKVVLLEHYRTSYSSPIYEGEESKGGFGYDDYDEDWSWGSSSDNSSVEYETKFDEYWNATVVLIPLEHIFTADPVPMMKRWQAEKIAKIKKDKADREIAELQASLTKAQEYRNKLK